MRQRNEVLVSTLRLLRADIQNREIELRKPLDDAGVVAIISKQVRQRCPVRRWWPWRPR